MNAERSVAVLRAFGGRVRSLRQQAGLATAEFAQRAQMTVEVLAAIEAGRYDTVGIDDVFQLADALCVQPAELFIADSPASGLPPDPTAAPALRLAADGGAVRAPVERPER